MRTANLCSGSLKQSYLSFWGLLALFLFLNGCAIFETYDRLHVNKGANPEYQGKAVLFRNLYYYRVLEYCKSEDQSSNIQILKDSLFRFRMTGKAYPILANQVNFESGILHKSQLDPFGATVTFNQKSGKFEFDSKLQTDFKETSSHYKNLDIEYKNIISLSEIFENKKNSIATEHQGLLKDYIKKRVDSLNALMARATAVSKSVSSTSGKCYANSSPNQEFLVLGPEGWRKFDPNYRLIMAMSTNGKPIIQPIKEMSGRILNAKSEQKEDGMMVKNYKKQILKAESYLNKTSKKNAEDIEIKNILDFLIKTLKGKNGGEQ